MLRSRRLAGPLLATALLCTPAASADEGPQLATRTRTLTLPEAIAFARVHHPAIRAGLARVQAQKADAYVPRAQWLPTVGVTAQLFGGTANNSTGSYATQSSLDIPRIGGTRSVSQGTLRPYPSTLVAAGVTQELFDFGRIAAEAAAEDARVDAESQRAREVALDVTFSVEEAYFSVFAAKEVLKASQDAYDRALVHRDLAKAGVGSGLRSPIELTRAEADLGRFDIGRLRARGGLVLAQTVLAAAVGAPDPALDVAEAAPARADMPALTDALDAASARDPRLLAAIAALRAEEQRTTAIGAQLRPRPFLDGHDLRTRRRGAAFGQRRAAAGAGWLPNVPNWDVGVVLGWPIFEGTIQARRDASRAREEVRRDEVAGVQQEQVAAIRRAYAAVDVARAVLPGLERAVEAAHANYAQADARFRAGLGTSVELADAEALSTEAEIQVALGQFEIARARAAFGRAVAEGS
jgi:outer membrane protein